jgi:hypothetical protein
LLGYFGGKFLRRFSGFLRRSFYVHTVFVGARGHEHFESPHALVAADYISDDSRIRVADVRHAVRVVQRRR